ncbi:MAG: DUF2142 domain-containing protein [Pseudobutyrivibrio sp.]|nr:DUF2142 domain-containing protein [Pseudobutyrivibrio sp.]
MANIYKGICKQIKNNLSYIVITVITIIFSITTIANSQGRDLKFSFPDNGVDYSTISWAEVPIDANGQEFSIFYEAWDIGQIGLRMSYDDTDTDKSFTLTIKDSADNEYSKEYVLNDLSTDSEGITWLDVGTHISAGNLKIALKSTHADNLKVIGYSQEGILDDNGNTAFSLNMQVNAASFPVRKAYLFSIVWILIVLIGILVLKEKKISFERLFAILYLTMGMMAFMVYTPFAEPDSGNHYRRAYAISEGDILPALDDNNAIGGNFAWPSTWGTDDGVSVSWCEAHNRMDFDVTAPENNRYLTYTNIALYSPVCHLIPALAMKIARLFTHSIIIIEMVAKVMNYIAIGILLYLGIKITPFGKEYFLWAILHPFMMKQYTSISPDIMTAALVYLLMTIVLRLRYDPNTFAKKGYLSAIYIVPFLLGQFKIVYVAFCLLLFLIPMDKFKSKKSYFIHATLIGLVTIVPALAWFKISSNILSMGYASTNSANTEIVMHLSQYIPILLNTFRIRSYDYIMQFFGYALVFKDGTNNAIVLIFIMIVSAYISRNIYKNKLNTSETAVIVKKDKLMKIIVSASITITTLLIFTAEYVQWSDPGASNVNGVRGRYFFPFIIPVLILLTGMSGTEEIDGEKADTVTYKNLFSLAMVTMCFMAQLYIVYQL